MVSSHAHGWHYVFWRAALAALIGLAALLWPLLTLPRLLALVVALAFVDVGLELVGLMFNLLAQARSSDAERTPLELRPSAFTTLRRALRSFVHRS